MSSPGLVIPEFETTVRVRLVDTTALMVVNSATLIQPVRVGHEHLNLPTVAFLIEHEAAEQRVMFDLGVRKDYWNFPPVLQQRLGKVIPSLRVDKDVTEILEEHGYSLDSFCKFVTFQQLRIEIFNLTLCLKFEIHFGYGDNECKDEARNEPNYRSGGIKL